MRVPAIVGAFPEPMRHGIEGKRLPVRVECEDSGRRRARPSRTSSAKRDVVASGASLGATGTET